MEIAIGHPTAAREARKQRTKKMPGLTSSPLATSPLPPPPPPIVIQPIDNGIPPAPMDDVGSPPPPLDPTPPMTLLEVIEPSVVVGPTDAFEVTLRCKHVYIIEGYGIVPFVWEEVQTIGLAEGPIEP